jgi:uncharacterized hydrophobic protein (TIGR00341 family)
MKLIEVVVPEGHLDTVASVAQQQELDYWGGGEIEGGLRSVRMFVPPDQRQAVQDILQHALETVAGAHILILPLEAVLPRPSEVAVSGSEKDKRGFSATREELYYGVEKGARLDTNYLLFVLLSTIVAAIGLIENNVAVIIGAMVIAPLLGPNIALALATSLGDTRLAWKALKAGLAGLFLALAVSVLIGVLWPLDQFGGEIMARTAVGLDGVALALASGAAAVLSLTTGLSSVLVGVMVAVALMPPTATLGMMLGQGEFDLAWGTGLLLLANVVCVNLAAKLVLVIRGVKPRSWFEQEKARQSVYAYITFWAVSLGLIVVVIYLRGV